MECVPLEYAYQVNLMRPKEKLNGIPKGNSLEKIKGPFAGIVHMLLLFFVEGLSKKVFGPTSSKSY